MLLSVRLSVYLSVRPSVEYIANNSRNQRPSVPQFGTKVPHFRCDSHTSFKVKRSKVRVTRPIEAGGCIPCRPKRAVALLVTCDCADGAWSQGALYNCYDRRFVYVAMVTVLRIGGNITVTQRIGSDLLHYGAAQGHTSVVFSGDAQQSRRSVRVCCAHETSAERSVTFHSNPRPALAVHGAATWRFKWHCQAYNVNDEIRKLMCFTSLKNQQTLCSTKQKQCQLMKLNEQ